MAWWDQQSPILSTVAAPFKALGVPGGMLRNVMVGRNPLDVLSDPDAAASGRDVLENYGWLDQNQEGLDAGDVAGFGAEMALDPLNWLSGAGALGLAYKGARGARTARKALPMAQEALPLAAKSEPVMAGMANALVPAGPLQGIPESAQVATRAANILPSSTTTIPLPGPVAGPWWQSRLADAAQGLPENVKAESLRNMLKKAPAGVADEEMDWVLKGLPQKGVVKKGDVLKHVDENKIRVEEKMLGAQSPAAKAAIEHGDTSGFTHEEMLAALRGETEGTAPKWSQYATPGGENYRELLLKLPPSTSKLTAETADAKLGQLIDKLRDEYGVKTYDEVLHAATPLERRKVKELEDALQFAMHNPSEVPYQSTHWQDDPNVLAHVRFDDRIAPDGGKTLFLHEVQSDWHQAGRARGYNPQQNAEAMIRNEKEIDALRNEYQDIGKRLGNKRLRQPGDMDRMTKINEEVSSLNKVRNDIRQGPIPDAPFKDKAWAELTMKRMLKYATDNGYGRIAWNNGELAQRYAAGGGGELKGLQAWYDETLPKMMAKLLKKQAKLEPFPVEFGGKGFDDVVNAAGEFAGGKQQVERHIVPSFKLPQASKDALKHKPQPLLSQLPWMLPFGIGAGAVASRQDS